jgi:ferritin-like metal-binding protein YciE
MFEKFNTPEELFKWQLGSALRMEKDILEMLDELIDESREQRLKTTLRSHKAQTHGHVENLERSFAAMGWEVEESPSPSINAIEKEGKTNIKKTEDSLVDLVILGGAMETEHHEIAVYENLIIHARAIGSQEAVALLQHNLEEEQDALKKVRAMAEELTRAHATQAAIR